MGRAFPERFLVKDAEEMRRKRVRESLRRGAETLKRRRLAQARLNETVGDHIVYDIVYDVVYTHIVCDVVYESE